jgi:ABC-type proline/glycine betaine transport system ATPase subunit
VTHDVNEAVYLSDRVLVFSSNPGRISGEIRVDLARPRDRRDPRLVRHETEVLTLLNGGESRFRDYLDISEEIAGIPRPRERNKLNTFAFAI